MPKPRSAEKLAREVVASYVSFLNEPKRADKARRTRFHEFILDQEAIITASKAEVAQLRAGCSLKQEYGQDHPWWQFDSWHDEFHSFKQETMPCHTPLRCFWRWTRKTGVTLDQSGIVKRNLDLAPFLALAVVTKKFYDWVTATMDAGYLEPVACIEEVRSALAHPVVQRAMREV